MGKDFGMIVSSDRDDVTKERHQLLNTAEKQLKYRKVVDLLITVPASPIGTSWDKEITFKFSSVGLTFPFKPMYQYRMKAYNGNWGNPTINSSQAYVGSNPAFPYFYREEYITQEEFHIHLYINNVNTGFTPVANYPDHTAILRLILTYDELEFVL